MGGGKGDKVGCGEPREIREIVSFDILSFLLVVLELLFPIEMVLLVDVDDLVVTIGECISCTGEDIGDTSLGMMKISSSSSSSTPGGRKSSSPTNKLELVCFFFFSVVILEGDSMLP